MRALLIKSLNLFRKTGLLIRKIRGKTEQDIANERIVSGLAWEEFCDTLKAAGASLTFPGTPQDPFNQAEGYRYLTRLTRAGLMAFVEHADPKAPMLHRVVHETVPYKHLTLPKKGIGVILGVAASLKKNNQHT